VIKIDPHWSLVHHGGVYLLAKTDPKTGGAQAARDQDAVSTSDKCMDAE